MKQEYFITTAKGKEKRIGQPWKIYESFGKWYFHPIAGKGWEVLTVHQQTGKEFIVYPRRENGYYFITEKETGLNCIPPKYMQNNRPKSFENALQIVSTYAETIINLIELKTGAKS